MNSCCTAVQPLQTLSDIVDESCFTPLTLADKDTINALLSPLNTLISEYSFTGLFCFAQMHDYSFSIIDDSLVIRGQDAGQAFLILPHGCGVYSQNDRLQATVRYFLQKGYAIKALSGRYRAEVREFLDGQVYSLVANENDSDYIYTKEALANLSGKKFHKKRNHIHYFLENNIVSSCQLTAERIDDARALLEVWNEQHEGKADYQETLNFLMYYDQLPLVGVICYSSRKAVGFAIGELRLGNKACVVHMEKSDLSVRGAAQYINQRFAQSLPPQCRLINREQDLGKAGLRKAKQSYHPNSLLPKYRIPSFVWLD